MKHPQKAVIIEVKQFARLSLNTSQNPGISQGAKNSITCTLFILMLCFCPFHTPPPSRFKGGNIFKKIKKEQSKYLGTMVVFIAH